MRRSFCDPSMFIAGLLLAGSVAAQEGSPSVVAAPPAPVAPAAAVVPAIAPVPAVSAAPAAPAAPAIDGATYTVRLRDIEAKVDELKENLRRSQARLTLLSDTVLSGGDSGCRAEIDFVNDIGSGLDLVGATITIDGVVQFNKQDENGALMATRSVPVLRAAVQPGDHTVQVKLAYRGSKGGLFSYMSAFRADVKGSHSFATSEGKVVRLKILATEHGGFFAPLDQRLGLEWPETNEKLQAEAPVKSEGLAP